MRSLIDAIVSNYTTELYVMKAHGLQIHFEIFTLLIVALKLVDEMGGKDVKRKILTRALIGRQVCLDESV